MLDHHVILVNYEVLCNAVLPLVGNIHSKIRK